MTPTRDFTDFGLTNPPNSDNPDVKQMLMWLCDVQWVLLQKVYERDKTGCHFGRVILDTMERTNVLKATEKKGFKAGFIAAFIAIGILAGMGATKAMTLLGILVEKLT